MSGNRDRIHEDRLRVIVEFEGRIVGEYDGFDGEHFYVVEVYGRIPEEPAGRGRLFDMMFFQYMIGRVTRTATNDAGDRVALMVDIIPAMEYIFTNNRFYGGILPTPENLQEYEDRDRVVDND